MKIGVISDTHRNRSLLDDAADWLEKRHRITYLYHLGDDYEDVTDCADRNFEIVQVPGIYHKGYRDGTLNPAALETVQGIRILLVHCLEKDATDEDRASADIIMHGHTHIAELKLEDGKLLFNPGHLKGPLDKTHPASFGLLEIQNETVMASLYNIDFKQVDRVEMMKTETGLYKAG